MPSIEKRLLTIPLRAGLSQKHDPFWLEGGAMLAAENAVKLKAETMQKRPGFDLLANTTKNIAGTTFSIAKGRRLGVFKNALVQIAADAFTDAIWQHDDQAAAPVLYDRMPETYVAPAIPIVSYELNLTEMDEVVSSGFRLVVYLIDVAGTGQNNVWSVVQDAVTGEIVVPPAAVTGGASAPMMQPKVVLCGTVAVCTYLAADGTALYANNLDMTAPWNGWSARATLFAPALGGIHVQDTAAAVGDTTSFGVILDFEASVGAGPVYGVDLFRCAAGTPQAIPPSLLQTATIADTTYTADGSPSLDGATLRVDATNGYVWWGYAYRYSSNTARRVRMGANTWTNIAAVNTAPLAVENITATPALEVRVMDIARVGNASGGGVGAQTDVHILAWSPANQALGSQWIKTAEANKIQGLLPNQPRLTSGVTLASRIVTANDRAYVGGYLNSTVQGTYYLLAIDSWSDLDTANGAPGYPMRLVATIAPRLASAPPKANGAFASHRVLPHIVANASAPEASTFEWCVSVNKAPGIGNPTVYPISFDSTHNYASAELGQNLAIACGAPQAFDGERAFELGFPYVPEISLSQVAANGAILGGAYSYVAIYETRDRRGQLHRSGRSPAFAVTVANSFSGTITTGASGLTTSAVSYNTGPSSPPVIGPNYTNTASAALSINLTGGNVQNNTTQNVTGKLPVTTWTAGLGGGTGTISASLTGSVTSSSAGILSGSIGGQLDSTSNITDANGKVFVNLTGQITVTFGGTTAAPTATITGFFGPNAVINTGDSSTKYSGTFAGTNLTGFTVAAASVTITVPVMGFSGRQKAGPITTGTSQSLGYLNQEQPIGIKLYRTTAGGTVYYNVDPSDVISPNPGVGPPTGVSAQLNKIDNSNLTLNLVDNTPDSTLTTHALLYGDGGLGNNGSSLDSLCPPPFQHLITHKNRIFGVDGNRVWYSKAYTTYEGSAFHDAMTISVDDGAGPVVALASMDDKLIIFKKSSIYFVSGDGPADNGGMNDFIPPQPISRNIGCIDWRSVVVTTRGVQFWSARGRFVLSRDLQIASIPTVEDAMSTNPVPTSAIVHPTRTRIVETANTDDVAVPRVGIGISYDEILDSWTTWKSKQAGVVRGAVSAAVANSLYHWQREDGRVLRESATSFLDAGAFQGMTLQSPWINASDIQNFARFRRLFVSFASPDPHAISVFVSYDYSSTQILLATFTAAQIAAFATPSPNLALTLPRHRATAVQFTITDATDVGTVTGQGPIVLGLTLEAGVYTNQRGIRVPAAQRN